LIACERDSIEARKCDIPDARSWYVALGWMAERKAFGLNDFDVIRIDAPEKCTI
jgi:hypothetical protein